MWGLAGMILFVPIVAVLRIVLAHSKHRFARMMLDVLVKVRRVPPPPASRLPPPASPTHRHPR